MNAREAEECLARATVGRMGTSGPGGLPYVVPLNFVFDAPSRTIFLHCATSGHLLDNLAYNPQACFEVDEPGELIAPNPRGCDTSQVYKSTICFGTARVVTEPQAKERALRLFLRKYVDQLMPGRSYDPELTTARATTVIALQVELMTGKRRRAG